MNNRTAVVFGATGLVGSYLLDELTRIEAFEKITVFTRKNIPTQNNKIEMVIHDLTDLDEIADKVKGSDLFCCIGTTIKKAGSQNAFKRVDLLLPAKIGEIAAKNGIRNFAVVSSIGANVKSNNFYLKVKGMMEQEILRHPFAHIVIVRPSLLLGDRKEFRFGEVAAKFFMPLINPFLKGTWRKYRSIHGRDVAKAMINLVLFPRNKNIYESDELQDISNSTV